MALSEAPAENCLFCRPKDRILYSNDLAFVARDTYPVTKGHTLVVLRRHVASIFDATAEERVALLELMDAAKKGLDEEFAPDGYTIGINDGAAAGQSHMHLHLHLIPRYKGDAGEGKGVRWMIPERAAYPRKQ
jgi:diadenosine tetraphosphate (Ap4A) HIT family hydrolase